MHGRNTLEGDDAAAEAFTDSVVGQSRELKRTSIPEEEMMNASSGESLSSLALI